METVKKSKKKAGRPAKAVKKEIRAAVRFTYKEHFIIKEKAKQAGLTVSEYIRQTAIYAEVKTRLTDEDRQIARRLVGMDNNLNQIAKTCHQQGLLSAMLLFEGYRDQMDHLLKMLKHDQ